MPWWQIWRPETYLSGPALKKGGTRDVSLGHAHEVLTLVAGYKAEKTSLTLSQLFSFFMLVSQRCTFG